MENAREAYDLGRAAHGRTVAALDGRARALGTARLVVAVLAVAVLGGIVWAPFDSAERSAAWVVLGAMVVGFVVLVLLHARVHDARRRAAATVRFYDRGLARLSHTWELLSGASDRFGAADHPFARDLDVFGRASLMQLVDATETRFGEERLAGLLSAESPAGWPDGTAARQEAARELAPRLPFRETLATLGGVLPSDDRRDPTAMLRWAEATEPVPSSALRWLSWLLPGLAVGVIAVGPFAGLHGGWIVGLVLAEMVLGQLVGARLTPTLECVSERLSSVTQWRAMIEVIERESFEARVLVGLRGRFASGGSAASAEIARLERIVGFADARRNEVFRFIFGAILMWDAHCALALLRWRSRAGAHLRGWLAALGELDALASLAGFAFEHPEFVWPALTTEPVFEAQALGHPLIATDRRVNNDVSLASGGRALVITGSNMSGKSTLLRAIGANAVLALAGAPVCARSLRIGPVRVATSMRIEDSLEEGVSHFYAELRRLKGIVDRAVRPGRLGEPEATEEGATGQNAAVLFLLDEILHGTNSRERIIGACAVVRDLVSHGALGAVSTHDLGITALERELPGKIENAHFEEQVRGDTMTFDYVLRPGIVQSSNALRLMRAVGLDVPDDVT